MGNQLYVCEWFPQGETVSEKFPWIRKKEQKNYPDSSLGKFYRLKKPKEAQPITRKWNVSITYCLGAEFVLAPTRENWTRISNIQHDFEHFCECFSSFYVK